MTEPTNDLTDSTPSRVRRIAEISPIHDSAERYVEATISVDGTVTLDAEDGAGGMVEMRLTVDELTRIHHAIGHLLYQYDQDDGEE